MVTAIRPPNAAQARSGDGPPPPEFTRGSALLAEAYRFALRAHAGPADRVETGVAHPVAVARLVAELGLAEEAVAAALLHDVIEDTEHEQGEIGARFPARVAELVAVMTEDAAIDSYPERKAEHRERVLAAGRMPASIYLADKLARVRRYAELRKPIRPERLEHYRSTVELFSRDDPELPFLAELRRELPDPAPAG